MPLRPLFGLAPFWKQCSPGVTLPAERGGPGPLPRTFQWLRAGGREGPLVPRSAIDARGAHGAFVGLGRVRWGFALLLLHLHFPWSVPDRPTRRPWSPPSLTLCLSASGLPASLWPKATVAGRLAPLCASHSADVAEAARPLSPSRAGPLPAPHCARGAHGRSALLPSLDSGQFPGELLALPADLLSRHCFTLDGFQVTELTELSSSSSMAWTPHPGTRTSSQPRRPDYVLPLRAAASPAEQHGAIHAPSA